MLIYVDKKKEKRRKIKIFCIILFIIIFIGLNIFSYRQNRLHGQEDLASYKKITYRNNWYNKAAPIYLFSNSNRTTALVIIVPAKLNKEIAQTLAAAFLKIPRYNYNLTLSNELEDIDFLKQIFDTAVPSADSSTSGDIIITSDFTKVEPIIKALNLYPKMINYTKARNLSNEHINNLLNRQYPPQPKAQTKIEKEQQALFEFAKENKQELINLISQNIQPQFSKQATFLENTRLCLQKDDRIQCQMQPDTSLLLNIKNALENFPKDIQPQKLLLLTSNEKIRPTDIQNLNNDEGIYFRFNERETFLLPQELSVLTKHKEPLSILKEKAGFNPEYTSPQMELYKFKITEVILDE